MEQEVPPAKKVGNPPGADVLFHVLDRLGYCIRSSIEITHRERVIPIPMDLFQDSAVRFEKESGFKVFDHPLAQKKSEMAKE
jgi:hypothetical protein